MWRKITPLLTLFLNIFSLESVSLGTALGVSPAPGRLTPLTLCFPARSIPGKAFCTTHPPSLPRALWLANCQGATVSGTHHLRRLTLEASPRYHRSNVSTCQLMTVAIPSACQRVRLAPDTSPTPDSVALKIVATSSLRPRLRPDGAPR